MVQKSLRVILVRSVHTALRAHSDCNDDLADALALRELSFFRDGVLSPGFSISHDELEAAFSSFL